MNLTSDTETGGFYFTWTIENFSFSFSLQKEGDCLDSPLFTFNEQSSTQWGIRLYKSPDALGCVLFRVDGFFPHVRFVFSFLNNRGSYKKNEIVTLVDYHDLDEYGECFLTHEELLKTGDDGFLKNDALTIRCRMWTNVRPTRIGQSYARTILHAERISFVWALEDFTTLEMDKQENITVRPESAETSFFISLYLTDGRFGKKKIQIEIKQIKTKKPFICTCDVAVLTSERKFVPAVQDEHSFQISEVPQIWKLPIIWKNKLLSKAELYLPNDMLSLRFNLAISMGVLYSKMENTEYRIIDDHQANFHNQFVESDSPASLSVDMQHLFDEQKFSDLILRTPNKDFAIHKAILCARSQVFSAMFEHDMEENQTNVIEIKDLNNDIVSKMLFFVYTDTIGKDIEWESAYKLYSAADKYGILGLKRKCFHFMKDHLNATNVCDMLVLADRHQDEDMKSAARDFIASLSSQNL